MDALLTNPYLIAFFLMAFGIQSIIWLSRRIISYLRGKKGKIMTCEQSNTQT